MAFNRKQYRIDNKEKIRLQDKQYRIDNKEKIRLTRASPEGQEKLKKYREDNKEHTAARFKQYRRDNKEHLSLLDRTANFRKRGLSIEQVESLILSQNNRCLCCLNEFIGRGHIGTAPNVDHCHTTGIVRGVVCAKCNKMLGLSKDSPTTLRNAANYLEGKLV
jgi:hypothetical protein